MISPLSVEALSLADRGYRICVHDDELRITRKGSTKDVRINCVYTKDEIDNMIHDVNEGGGDGSGNDDYFQLNESDQLYLYKPSSVMQTSKYYMMSWDIDPNYELEDQTEFTFKDYLFGHTWALTWNGSEWIGNDTVNLSFNKQSTADNNHGHPTLIVQHTDYISKWINCFREVYPTDNYATALSSYVTNWRVAYRGGTII